MWIGQVSLVLMMMMTPPSTLSGTLSGCQFPSDWLGSWHHLGHDNPLNVSLSSIDTKGTCFQSISSDADINKTGFGQFIMKEEKGCLKCMIIYRKHHNVLQYREGDCETRQSLMSRPGGLTKLCSEIPGDTAMYSMIRLWSKPVQCPIQGPHSVSYGKGGATKHCTHPPSLMDSCSDDSVLQIKYQACPDIQGSESRVERMTCVAKWKEGNKRYFVALVNSKHSQWAEQKDRYQCFLYEDISNQMKMSQGQFSASCQGLWSVLEGSRTFSLQKLSGGNSCKLPEAIRYNQRWRSLNHELSIHIDSDNTSFSFLKSGTLLEQVTCHSVDMIEAMEMNNADEVQMVAHVKSGCSSGYICFILSALNKNIVNITYGLKSNHPHEACQHYYFSSQTWKSSILVAENTSTPCPFSGSYSVSGSSSSTSSPSSSRSSWILPPPEVSGDEDLAEKYQMLKEKENKNGDRCSTFMQAGCSNSHSLEVRSACEGGGSTSQKESLLCHGIWRSSASGTQYHLVLSSQAPSLTYFCLDYTDKDGVVEGRFNEASCGSMNSSSNYVNISSTGPCILPLTAGDLTSSSASSVSSLVVALLICSCTIFLKRGS